MWGGREGGREEGGGVRVFFGGVLRHLHFYRLFFRCEIHPLFRAQAVATLSQTHPRLCHMCFQFVSFPRSISMFSACQVLHSDGALPTKNLFQCFGTLFRSPCPGSPPLHGHLSTKDWLVWVPCPSFHFFHQLFHQRLYESSVIRSSSCRPT